MIVWDIKPYNDEDLIYDDESGMYILTERATDMLGLGIRESVAENKGASVDTLIHNFLKRVSYTVYAYIHSCNACEDLQDAYIAHNEEARRIVKEALKNQVIYMRAVGDTGLSFKSEERERKLDDITIEILNRRIPCLGHSLVYAGRW